MILSRMLLCAASCLLVRLNSKAALLVNLGAGGGESYNNNTVSHVCGQAGGRAGSVDSSERRQEGCVWQVANTTLKLCLKCARVIPGSRSSTVAETCVRSLFVRREAKTRAPGAANYGRYFSVCVLSVLGRQWTLVKSAVFSDCHLPRTVKRALGDSNEWFKCCDLRLE